jgi:hypothetical protein
MTRHGASDNTSSHGEGSSSRITDSITTGTTQRSGDSQDIETVFAGEIVRQIEALVESFRTGKAKKSHTFYKISQILAEESSGDEQLKSDALDRYSTTLDGIEAQIAKLNEHGLRLTSPVLGKQKEDLGKGSQRYEPADGSNP